MFQEFEALPVFYKNFFIFSASLQIWLLQCVCKIHFLKGASMNIKKKVQYL